MENRRADTPASLDATLASASGRRRSHHSRVFTRRHNSSYVEVPLVSNDVTMNLDTLVF
jgi:hypothetical protein